MSTVKINSTTKVTDGGRKGFWLWDEARGMNLSMRAESERAALIDALEYYQRRLLDVEEDNKLFRKTLQTVASAVIQPELELELDLDYE